jgi:hypothetical protein
MDGMNSTYERLRGRPFGHFVASLEVVRATARFGINFLVNDDTIKDLPRAADFALEEGAEELLLLPEIPVNGRLGPTEGTLEILEHWIQGNWANYPLRTSAMSADRLAVPVARSSDGRRCMDFLHIDAAGVLKTCAFDSDGVALAEYSSLLDALDVLCNDSDGQLAAEEI